MTKCFHCIADEPLEITYSYWDGAGHRRVIQVGNDYFILKQSISSCFLISTFNLTYIFCFPLLHSTLHHSGTKR